MTRRSLIKSASTRIYERRCPKAAEHSRNYQDLHLRLVEEVQEEKRGKKSS